MWQRGSTCFALRPELRSDSHPDVWKFTVPYAGRRCVPQPAAGVSLSASSGGEGGRTRVCCFTKLVGLFASSAFSRPLFSDFSDLGLPGNFSSSIFPATGAFLSRERGRAIWHEGFEAIIKRLSYFVTTTPPFNDDTIQRKANKPPENPNPKRSNKRGWQPY